MSTLLDHLKAAIGDRYEIERELGAGGTVEVLSPCTASRDRGVKRRLYLEAGVEEYWIIHIDARIIEHWHWGDARPEIIEQSLEWSLSAGVGGVIEVASLFET